MDHFRWFFLPGLVLGAVFVGSKRLLSGIVIHWIVILVALLGISSALEG